MKNSLFLKILLFLVLLTSIYYFVDKNYSIKYYKNIQEVKDDNLASKSEKTNKELDILFVGDVMLDRNIRKIINEQKTPENFVRNFLDNFSIENKKYDYIVANLEGPITENKTKTYDENGRYTKLLLFTFPITTPKILNLLNIKIVSLANNHTDNFYNSGFQDTKKYLDLENIKYFGNPYNENKKESLSNIVCEKEICIAYIGYHEFTKENDSLRIENEIKNLKESKKADFIVVVPHWGEEYRTTSNKNQKYLAHKWIDVGADMVIGMHPHVVEESEIYKDKYIYYSLGNYIFDQWFNEDVKNGLAVNFKFIKEIKGEEVIKNIEFIKEIKVRSEKTGIKYMQNL